MLILVNDTKVVDIESEAKASGGTSSFISEYLSFLKGKKIEIGLVGNFDIRDTKVNYRHIIQKSSNMAFMMSLFFHFFLHRFTKKDVIHFQRPDHVFSAIFTKSKKSCICMDDKMN